MQRSIVRRTAAGAAAAALTLVLGACGAANESSGSADEGSGLSGTLDGAGASSQEAAQQAWRAAFSEKHPDVTVNYSPIGSGGGRERFVNGASDFGGTDAALEGEELKAAKERCGSLVEVPVYVSPVAVAFNLDGVDELKLTPQTIAGIFNQEITNWDAEAIKRSNPDVDLPSTPITPVNRSDESGTTENFVDYLSTAAPDAWPHEVSGNWPVSGGEAAKGTSGVKSAINAGNGTIGYLDASQAGDLGTVAVGVGDEFVSYSPEAAAKVVEVSERKEGQGEHVFAYDLARDTTESGTYPIVLVSYGMACGSYDDAETGELVRSYFQYLLSEEGQQAAADAAGSAPISDGLRQKLQPAVEAIGASS
ncbi:phosphate transport system substrate-binding protein [Actinopolyspora xinjiangensis]|uniref:Phosphate-binding protein n=1 Tax=Actinopolyspora xinjiangensis TaxID=405564 RepID=A0A1H0VY79_9ACTN|nr:phosphate ABC transporter substrate-binding protein PstS [Actinopolyspora xinjiangensis]SDP83281.1 phosphate transport system substrate-binding protein [Actinopolyspora xinjiangensis]